MKPVSEIFEDEQAELRDKRASSQLIRAGQVASAIAALIAAGLAVWALVKPGGPAAVLKVMMTSHKTEAPRSEFSYFDSHPTELAREEARLHALYGLSKQEIQEELEKKLGVTVEFDVETQGPTGHVWNVTETLFNKATGERVREANSSIPPERYTSTAGDQTHPFPSWFEYPPHAGRYYVEIELNDGKGSQETAKTASFQVP
jgi:hypothetical protein